MTQYGFAFDAPTAPDRDLLGGKGAGLAEMTRLGLPVPPGFTLSTQACLAFLEGGAFPPGLWDQVRVLLEALEKGTGKTFGTGPRPLLLSVRSGARFSMPGMMDTLLNLGLNDQTVQALALESQDPRFAWDSYRRFIALYGDIVGGVARHHFEDTMNALKRARGVQGDLELSAKDLERLVAEFKALYLEHGQTPFPQDPLVQLEGAIQAVFSS